MTSASMEYRLYPINPDSPRWSASTYKGECTVRARLEREARDMADFAFQRPVTRGEVPERRLSPWLLTNVTGIEVRRRAEAGALAELGVINPPGHNGRVSRIDWDRIEGVNL